LATPDADKAFFAKHKTDKPSVGYQQRRLAARLRARKTSPANSEQAPDLAVNLTDLPPAPETCENPARAIGSPGHDLKANLPAKDRTRKSSAEPSK